MTRHLWVLYNPELGKRGWWVGDELPEQFRPWVEFGPFVVEDKKDFATYVGGKSEGE
jgi:hypothetical protein